MNMVNERSRRHISYIQNAYIEKVFRGKNAVILNISYVFKEASGIPEIRIVTLFVSKNTRIRNQYNQRMQSCELKEGMKIEALASKLRTASIAVQLRAYKIMARVENSNTCTKIDKIWMVDTNYEYFMTGNPDDLQEQIRFNLNPATKLLDHKGGRIRSCQLRAGQIVKIRHEDIEKSCIPVQTSACHVQLLD